MVKKLPGFVLASLKPSTYLERYASGFRFAAALLAERRVLARRGWAGEKESFLTIL